MLITDTGTCGQVYLHAAVRTNNLGPTPITGTPHKEVQSELLLTVVPYTSASYACMRTSRTPSINNAWHALVPPKCVLEEGAHGHLRQLLTPLTMMTLMDLLLTSHCGTDTRHVGPLLRPTRVTVTGGTRPQDKIRATREWSPHRHIVVMYMSRQGQAIARCSEWIGAMRAGGTLPCSTRTTGTIHHCKARVS